jgi:hypothetical protein
LVMETSSGWGIRFFVCCSIGQGLQDTTPLFFAAKSSVCVCVCMLDA